MAFINFFSEIKPEQEIVPVIIKSNTLVKVDPGDGIGFDIGDCIVVSNSANNVGLLMKSNYSKSFKPYKSLSVSDVPLTDISQLIPGKTYLVKKGFEHAFVKYLGNATVVGVFEGGLFTKTFNNKLPLPHYELGVCFNK